MPIQNVNRVKQIVFSPTRHGDTKRRRWTTPLKIPFLHPTQFPLNNPLHQLWIMTESVTANGLISALGQSLPKSNVRLTSAFPLMATKSQTSLHVGDGP
jgi:hypothetical protein